MSGDAPPFPGLLPDQPEPTFPASGPPEDAPPVHEFLFMSPRATVPPVEVMLTLRQAVADLPETAATWMPADHASYQAIKPAMLDLLGAWKVPDVYPASGGSGAKYVNPNYRSRSIYSDVLARCECGAVITPESRGGVDRRDWLDEHAGDCQVAWIEAAWDALDAVQRDVMERCYRLGLSNAEVRARVGATEDDTTMREVGDELGVSTPALLREGRVRSANTMAALLTHHPPDAVGQVYDEEPGTVRRLVRDTTRWRPGELRAYRDATI